MADDAVWIGGATGVVERLGFGDDKPRVVAEIDAAVAGVAVTDDRLFVGDTEGWRLLVYNRTTGKQERVLRMPGQVRGVLSALGSVWVTAGELVVQVDPRSLRTRAETRIGGQVAQMAVSGSALIVTNLKVDKITKLDAQGRVTASTEVGGWTIGITVDKTHIWVFFIDEPKARLIDRRSFEAGRVVELPGVAFDAAVVGPEVWAPITEEGVIARMSDDGKVLAQMKVGLQPVGIKTHGGSVWVAHEGQSSLWRLKAGAITGS